LAAFRCQPHWQRHSPPTPLTRQIPIDGEPLATARGFVLRRLSDAGSYPGRSLTPRRHPKPFTIPDIQSRALTKKGCIGWARRALRDIIFVQLHAAVDDHFEEHGLARR
jgi:hypothetical protein